ncbi:protein of unknown function [Pseudomonas mediterranea]
MDTTAANAWLDRRRRLNVDGGKFDAPANPHEGFQTVMKAVGALRKGARPMYYRFAGLQR